MLIHELSKVMQLDRERTMHDALSARRLMLHTVGEVPRGLVARVRARRAADGPSGSRGGGR